MDQFEREMLARGIPAETIQLVKASPLWKAEFQRYTQTHVDILVYLFPMIYQTLYPWVSTPEEFAEAKKHYVPMDTGA
jgi:hypothetical protein